MIDPYYNRRELRRQERRYLRNTYNEKTGKFHCPNCDSSFGKLYHLNEHFRYTCGKSPRFKCPYCEFYSKKSSTIYKHVRTKHASHPVTLIKLWG